LPEVLPELFALVAVFLVFERVLGQIPLQRDQQMLITQKEELSLQNSAEFFLGAEN